MRRTVTRIPIGIQLYTVRDRLAEDYPGTIRALAAMGYEGIELAGPPAIPVGDLKRLVEDLGLEIAGAHAPLDDLRNDLDRILEDQQALGNKRIVLPWLPEEIQQRGREGYLEVADFLNRTLEKIAPLGFSLSYHNHSFEFVPDCEGYLLDTLLEAGAKGGLMAELDTYWIRHGGADPVEYIDRYTGHVELLHIKDMGPGEDRPFAEVGSGILDWDAIFAAAARAGVQWLLVEQDVCPGPSLDSARKSLDYLRSRGMLG